MEGIYQLFHQDPQFQTISEGIRRGLREQLVAGLSGSSRHLFLAALYRQTGRSQLIVTHNMFQAQKVYDDLSSIVSPDDVFLYPVNELIVSEVVAASPEVMAQRIQIQSRLLQKKSTIVITPFAGVRRILPPASLWLDQQFLISKDEELNLTELLPRLLLQGYERVDLVEKPGEFSLRGGILDIFPMLEENPVRIELFDVEIDSMRTFSVETQRSIQEVDTVWIVPAREVLVTGERMQKAAEELNRQIEGIASIIGDHDVRQQLQDKLSHEAFLLKSGEYFSGIYKYAELLYPEKNTLLDYMGKDTILIIDEPSRVQDSAQRLELEEAEWQIGMTQIGEMLPGATLSIRYEEWKSHYQHPILYISLFLKQVAKSHVANVANYTSRSMQQFHGQIHVLKTEMQRWRKEGMTILFCASDKERAQRLQHVLHDYQMDVDLVLHGVGESLPSHPTIFLGQLQSGFELPFHRFVVVTEEEVFVQKKQPKRKQVQIDNTERIKSYQELQPGDYVVHINHGIGRYLGIETLEVEGIHKDYLNIHYAGEDRLYVPIDQIDQVQKYLGGDERPPKVNRLGGSEWKRTKSKVKASVQDIAQDLIQLYAKREAAKGYAFERDSEDQRAFESLFPYEETPDQLRTIEEIKRDMESPQPMDRLLCGDVGYGKTEVAMRAAFKAAMEGKQVAVLVPTTILAQQHEETFRQRFAGFPLEIRALSRFRTRKEQQEILKGLKEGTVDIVIGTHRLLSSDVQFRDLGLLIVDEEQRFGVKHKERIKQLKTNVDVLTLTATPIPRTLHMSMLGVRDLSVIETPPENRFPVQTYVVEYTPALVREAIERELARNGQVFYLYNRVDGIERMTEQIAALVPNARVVYAHGQMGEHQLERIMLDFLDGQFDVLVSTTIIESGVDIPNVNTLLIHDADRLGLSQLYQLRGRVGRSNRIAYAYFMYQRNKVLREDAEKRLQAIKEFTQLGSGFKIAMRDLAIRGAGNLLGSEQHGFIASVGLDLYTKMLKDAIRELKGEQEEEPFQPEIDLKIDAYLPSTYIEDNRQKIEMYKRIASITNMEALQDLIDEMVDRYGEPPLAVQNLLTVAKIRVYCYCNHIPQIQEDEQRIKVTLQPVRGKQLNGARLLEHMMKVESRRLAISSGEQIHVFVKKQGLSEQEKITILDRFLDGLNQVFEEDKTA
ncbi:transcription-repair coupling factor [Rubeoparvulum massiliense]|uniref:transcription-repair coupling factor n=1 Tax=Rubeoparvulum massiliense TaxID=1631346 RepID=UPI00065DEA3F|nr:transcription-repair coupling factor [Rubeoparvulum massiliense]